MITDKFFFFDMDELSRPFNRAKPPQERPGERQRRKTRSSKSELQGQEELNETQSEPFLVSALLDKTERLAKYGEKARIGRSRLSDISGRLGGAIRRSGAGRGKIGKRRFPRTEEDGDGDGFRTNPRTGEDDIPVTPQPPKDAPTGIQRLTGAREGSRKRKGSEQPEQVRKMVGEGKQLEEIAKALGVTEGRVREIIRDNKLVSPKQHMVNERLRRIEQLLRTGAKIPDIARMLDLSISIVGHEVDKLKGKKRSGPQVRRIQQLIDEGKTASEIADQLGMSKESIRSIMSTAGITSPERQKKEAKKARILELLEEGKSVSEIAKEVGYGITHVSNIIRRAGATSPKSRRANAKKKRVAELVAQGATDAEIAKDLGISKSSVRGLVYDAGASGVRVTGPSRGVARTAESYAKRNAAIIDMANSGSTLQEIQDAVNLSDETIKAIIRKAGGTPPRKPASRRIRGLSDSQQQDIVQQLKDGVDVSNIARSVGVAPGRIVRFAKLEGIMPKRTKKGRTEITPEMAERIAQLRKEGLTIEQIAQELNIGTVTVSKYIRLGGLPNTRPRKVTASTRERLAELVKEGRSNKDIAEELGISEPRVGQLINQEGLTGQRPKGRRSRAPEDRLSPEQLDQVMTMLAEGKSRSEIARSLKIPLVKVSAVADILEVPKKRLAANDIDRIIALRKQGAKLSDLASQFGVDKSYLSRILKGVTPELPIVRKPRELKHLDAVKKLLDDNPNITLQQIADAVGISLYTASAYKARLGAPANRPGPRGPRG